MEINSLLIFCYKIFIFFFRELDHMCHVDSLSLAQYSFLLYFDHVFRINKTNRCSLSGNFPSDLSNIFTTLRDMKIFNATRKNENLLIHSSSADRIRCLIVEN